MQEGYESSFEMVSCQVFYNGSAQSCDIGIYIRSRF